jgi:RNA polymerase sigma-70 factor (ECF subfamily)
MRATLSDSPPLECVLNAWRDHESELRSYLVRCVSDKHLVEDLLQEVFVRALRSGQGFCGLDNARAWLFQVARNALVDQRRLEKRAVPLPDDLPEKSEDGGRPVDALSECLARVLSELPAADREILQQCDIEGIKQQSFADAHGLSLAAVKSRILRARRRLRELMVKNCQVRFDGDGKVDSHVPRRP